MTRTTLTANQVTNAFGASSHIVTTSAVDMNTAGVNILRSFPPFNGENTSTASSNITSLAANVPGFKVMVMIDAYPDESQSFANQTAFVDSHAQYVCAIEGPNETDVVATESFANIGSNTTSGPSQSQFISMCQGISNWLSNDSNFKTGGSYIGGRKIPFVAPSMTGNAYGNGFCPTNGALANYVDFGSIHNYPQQQPWNANGFLYATGYEACNKSSGYAPGKACIASEIGHHTNPSDGADWITETSQAKMLLAMMLGNLASGSPFFTAYELKDQSGSSASGYSQPNGYPTDQQNYGLLRADGSSKVIARALNNIKTLLGDVTNTSYTPSSYPNISVSGLQNTGVMGGQLLAAKSDGSYWLILWNEPTLANFNGSNGCQNGADIVPANNYVSVTFDKSYNWSLYDTMNPIAYLDGTNQSQMNNVATQGTTAIATGSGSSISASSQTVNVQGRPLLLQLVAGSGSSSGSGGSGGTTPTNPTTTHGLLAVNAQGYLVTNAAGNLVLT